MQYGALTTTDSSFRAACMLFANDPVYSQMPLRRLVEFRELIQKKQTFCALDGDVLTGLVAWQPISGDEAREAVRRRGWPKGTFNVGDGGGLLLGAFIAPSREEALPFFRRFVDSSRGKILLMERHRPSRPPRFMWIDRSGRLFGKDL